MTFLESLIAARLSSAKRVPTEEENSIEDSVFGRSKFVGDVQGESSRTAPAYGDEGPLGQVVKDLFELDSNFRTWLTDQEIDPTRLDLVSENRRAQTLRKARNIMVARLEFRRRSGN